MITLLFNSWILINIPDTSAKDLTRLLLSLDNSWSWRKTVTFSFIGWRTMLLVPIWNSRQIATNASPIGETNFFKLVNIFYWMKIPQAWLKNIMSYIHHLLTVQFTTIIFKWLRNFLLFIYLNLKEWPNKRFYEPKNPQLFEICYVYLSKLNSQYVFGSGRVIIASKSSAE